MPPVRGPYVNSFSSFSLDPTSTYTAAWENKRVRPIIVDYSQLQVG
jgi:hypothetical protein